MKFVLAAVLLLVGPGLGWAQGYGVRESPLKNYGTMGGSDSTRTAPTIPTYDNRSHDGGLNPYTMPRAPGGSTEADKAYPVRKWNDGEWDKWKR